MSDFTTPRGRNSRLLYNINTNIQHRSDLAVQSNTMIAAGNASITNLSDNNTNEALSTNDAEQINSTAPIASTRFSHSHLQYLTQNHSSNGSISSPLASRRLSSINTEISLNDIPESSLRSFQNHPRQQQTRLELTDSILLSDTQLESSDHQAANNDHVENQSNDSLFEGFSSPTNSTPVRMISRESFTNHANTHTNNMRPNLSMYSSFSFLRDPEEYLNQRGFSSINGSLGVTNNSDSNINSYNEFPNNNQNSSHTDSLSTISNNNIDNSNNNYMNDGLHENKGSKNISNKEASTLTSTCNIITCPYLCCKRESMDKYIFKKAFLEGAYSDVTIRAFDHDYHLHKLFLDKSSYFKSLFNWPIYDNSESSLDTSSEDDDDRKEAIYDVTKEQYQEEEEEQKHTQSLNSNKPSNSHDINYKNTTNNSRSKKTSGKKTSGKQPKRTKSTRSTDSYVLIFDDETILQEAFELAIARLYGGINTKREAAIPYSMIAVGQFLGIPDVVCTATHNIISSMNISTVTVNLQFASSNNYGKASERIIECGKGILCSDGWQSGVEIWDGIPTDIIASVVGEDFYFVPSEWDRCIFIIKLLERRIEALSLKGDHINSKAPEASGLAEVANSLMSNTDGSLSYESIQILKEILNKKVYFCHLSPEQLQELELLCDINGDPYVDVQILRMALWQSLQLQTLVVNSGDSTVLAPTILGNKPPMDDYPWWRLPVKDETLSAEPSKLKEEISRSISIKSEASSSVVDSTISTQSIRSSTKMNVSHARSEVDRISYDSNADNQNQNNTEENRIYSWTKIPPFRFSIAFADVSSLPTDKRVYGKTFWYAGSYWNLYLQKNHITSKDIYQIGVYLHRANNGNTNSSKNGITNFDVFSDNSNYKMMPKRYKNKNDSQSQPFTSSKIVRSGNDNDANDQEKDNDTDEATSMMNDLSISSPNNATVSERTNRGGLHSPLKFNNVKVKSDRSILTYEDHRSAIRVYFIIFTPSRKSKAALTSFLSVPNNFNKSQSWGWKSNSMCVFNEDGTFPKGHDPHLKFMIVLGNV
ncbi:hypothetical protein BVG19_g932 [[Candida] boidinii]|nr:hypothetical protein BVG19_g932 [[Candida] boidinii]OWB50603.1 hypothetical protein B5S27_g2154 [[Candida] boidinii]